MAFNCVVDDLSMGGAAIASVKDVCFLGLSMDRNFVVILNVSIKGCRSVVTVFELRAES